MTSVGEILKQLIRIPSVSALSNLPVIEYAEQALHAAGWQTQRHEYVGADIARKLNLIAAPPGRSTHEAACDLAFVCHTDTVPFASSWADALVPLEQDGCILGCGACDVKGFLACLLQAALNGKNRKAANVRIVLTADEEVGCVGARHLVAAGLLHPAGMVIGEPTGLHPARAGKGYCLGQMRVTGKEAHSAHPDQGASAILAAAHLLVALEQLAERLESTRNPFFNPAHTTLNAGVIEGGTAKNVIPGLCTFMIEWRPVPGADAAEIAAAIDQLARDEMRANPRVQCEFKRLRQQDGFETPASSGLVKVVEEHSGRAASSIPFGSEASIFAAICKDIVVFGPGDMQTAHSEREHVAIADLAEAVRCIDALMFPGHAYARSEAVG